MTNDTLNQPQVIVYQCLDRLKKGIREGYLSYLLVTDTEARALLQYILDLETELSLARNDAH